MWGRTSELRRQRSLKVIASGGSLFLASSARVQVARFRKSHTSTFMRERLDHMTFIEACCASASLKDALEKDLGFRGGILEVINKLSESRDEFFVATRRTVTMRARGSFEDLKTDLTKAREECDIVALYGDNEQVLRRLVEAPDSYLFDVLRINLESIGGLKPPFVKALLNRGIMLEVNISQLFVEASRGRCLSNARHVVRTLVRRSKGIVELILSTSASTPLGLREVEEIVAIGVLLGLREADARNAISKSVDRLLNRAGERKRKYLAAKERSLSKPTLSLIKKRGEGSHELDESRKKAALWNGFD